MTRTRWKLGAANVAISAERGTLLIDFGGTVTQDALDVFWRRVKPGLCGPAYVLVVRLDRAEIAVSAEQMTDRLRNETGRLKVPAAVVCRPEDLLAVREHCQQAAEHGFTRQAFVSLSEARAWAEERAAAARLSQLLAQGAPAR